MYDLLREALEERPNVSYSVRCQFLEIYGEDIHDLLEPAGSTVTIREGQNGEVNVHGAKEMPVHGAEVRFASWPCRGRSLTRVLLRLFTKPALRVVFHTCPW